jgi:hypothetical protein
MTWAERRNFGKWELRQATLLVNAARTSEIFKIFSFFLGENFMIIIVRESIVRESMLNSLENKFRVLDHVDGITKRSVEFSLLK